MRFRRTKLELAAGLTAEQATVFRKEAWKHDGACRPRRTKAEQEAGITSEQLRQLLGIKEDSRPKPVKTKVKEKEKYVVLHKIGSKGKFEPVNEFPVTSAGLFFEAMPFAERLLNECEEESWFIITRNGVTESKGHAPSKSWRVKLAKDSKLLEEYNNER